MMTSLFGSLLFTSTIAVSQLNLPPGFKVGIYAEVENARQMTLGKNGTVFVGSRGAGKVIALVDQDRNGVADKHYLIDDDLYMPSGVAFKDGHLYVAAVNRILRYRDIEGRLEKPPEPEVIVEDLPDDSHHGWKAIEFSPGGELYVPVGVPCNICRPEDKRYGTILKLDIESGHYSVFASGVRNSVGLAFSPVDNALWFTDNGRDWMGDDRPPDEINRAASEGLHFGFPYRHGRNIVEPDFKITDKTVKFTSPSIELGAHVAPLGLEFYKGKAFPRNYRNSLFVAEHGSWNRSGKVGYRVVSIRFDGNKVISVEPFITGWLDKEEDTAWGRPVDVLNMPDGSILVSDDAADIIYRISYERDI